MLTPQLALYLLCILHGHMERTDWSMAGWRQDEGLISLIFSLCQMIWITITAALTLFTAVLMKGEKNSFHTVEMLYINADRSGGLTSSRLWPWVELVFHSRHGFHRTGVTFQTKSNNGATSRKIASCRKSNCSLGNALQALLTQAALLPHSPALGAIWTVYEHNHQH